MTTKEETRELRIQGPEALEEARERLSQWELPEDKVYDVHVEVAFEDATDTPVQKTIESTATDSVRAEVTEQIKERESESEIRKITEDKRELQVPYRESKIATVLEVLYDRGVTSKADRISFDEFPVDEYSELTKSSITSQLSKLFEYKMLERVDSRPAEYWVSLYGVAVVEDWKDVEVRVVDVDETNGGDG